MTDPLVRVGPWIAWDADGSIIATIDEMVPTDPETGEALGSVDFASHEAAGGRMREVAEMVEAVGSGTFPEFLGMAAHDFKVELDPGWTREDSAHPFYVTALVHRSSRVKRKRVDVEKRIRERLAESDGKPVAVSDITGGPDMRGQGGSNRNKRLDASGRDVVPPVAVAGPALPLLQSALPTRTEDEAPLP